MLAPGGREGMDRIGADGMKSSRHGRRCRSWRSQAWALSQGTALCAPPSSHSPSHPQGGHCVHTRTHTYTHMQARGLTQACRLAHTRAHTQMHIHIDTWAMHTHAYRLTHFHTCTHKHTRAHPRMHAHGHTHTHARTRAHTHCSPHPRLQMPKSGQESLQ